MAPTVVPNPPRSKSITHLNLICSELRESGLELVDNMQAAKGITNMDKWQGHVGKSRLRPEYRERKLGFRLMVSSCGPR